MEIQKENIIEIAKLSDGNYLIKRTNWQDTDENGNKTYSEETQAVTGETDDETLKNLLEAVAEECGYCYDKYGENNLEVEFHGVGSKIK